MLCVPHSALCSLHSTRCTGQSQTPTLSIDLHCRLHTHHTQHDTLYTLESTLRTSHAALHTTHFSRYRLLTTRSTLYTSAVQTLHSTLHTLVMIGPNSHACHFIPLDFTSLPSPHSALKFHTPLCADTALHTPPYILPHTPLSTLYTSPFKKVAL